MKDGVWSADLPPMLEIWYQVAEGIQQPGKYLSEIS
jgi:hypothetical protein